MKTATKIAVIGSGISGLTACYQLKNKAEVFLFEKGPKLGMAAHGTQVDFAGKSRWLDVPFRTMKRSYYPGLFSIYEKAGIQTRKVDYSFRVEHNHNFIFSFNSYQFRKKHFAIPSLQTFFRPTSRRILRDLLRFFKESRDGKAIEDISIADFLQTNGYSEQFAKLFLYPTFSLINTCKNKTVSSYPAKSILQYNHPGLAYDPQETAMHGSADAAQRLSQGVTDFLPGTQIERLEQKSSKIRIHSNHGIMDADYLICATQANQAANLLVDVVPEQAKLLKAIPYESSEVILHTDQQLFGKRNKTLLFQNRDDQPMPQVTLDLARIYPELKGSNFFQTWNPHTIPEKSKLLNQSKFERPIIDNSAIHTVQELIKLQNQNQSRVLLCGSYMGTGIPLLEAGVKSAVKATEKLQSVL